MPDASVGLRDLVPSNQMHTIPSGSVRCTDLPTPPASNPKRRQREVSDYALARMADGDRGVVRGVYRSSLNIQTPGLILHVGGMGEQLSCLGMGIGTLRKEQIGRAHV